MYVYVLIHMKVLEYAYYIEIYKLEYPAEVS